MARNPVGVAIIEVESPLKRTNLQRRLKEEKRIVSGKVRSYNGGGVEVDLGPIQGFVPGSQLSEDWQDDWETLVGETLQLMVIDDRKGLNDSRFLSEKEAVREIWWLQLEEEEIRGGTVTNVKSYVAFVDIEGIDGLIHHLSRSTA